MQDKGHAKRKTGNIISVIKKIPLGTFVYLELYDITTEDDQRRAILDTKKINLLRMIAIGYLIKKTDIQISLAYFYNVENEDDLDEDFIHIPIGCVYKIVELVPK